MPAASFAGEPAATKGRWVRASRAAGMRLTEWIVDAVEAHMQHGGPVADDLIDDVVAEENSWQTVSHQPGREGN